MIIVAIFCEALSVIVRKETVETVLNISPETLIERFPGGSCWQDENLIRFGFMAPDDVGRWINYLERIGLTFVDTTPSGFSARDISVVDQHIGPTCECNWLETQIIESIRWVWEKGKPPGSYSLPVDLEGRELDFIPNEEIGKVTRSFNFNTGLDEIINPNSGRPAFVARVPSPTDLPSQIKSNAQRFNDLLSLGDHAYKSLDLQSSYDCYLLAEQISPLTDEHILQAANVAIEVWKTTFQKHAALVAYHRCVYITELGPGVFSSELWGKRALLEKYLAMPRDARRSYRRAKKLRKLDH